MVKISELSYGQLFVYQEESGFASVCQYWGEQYGRAAICGLGSKCAPRFIDKNIYVFCSLSDLQFYLENGYCYEEE